MIAKSRPMKPWYTSRTIWLGVLSIAAAVVTALIPVVGPITSAAILGGVGAANIALRATERGEP